MSPGNVVDTTPSTIPTDEQLIAENHQIEALLKQATDKLNEWAKPHKARLTEIEDELFRRLKERGADSTSTEAGTAYISTIMSTKVEDREKLFDFVAENWETVGAEVQLNLAKGAVQSYMEHNNGLLPPGISNSYFQRLNIKRS